MSVRTLGCMWESGCDGDCGTDFASDCDGDCGTGGGTGGGTGLAVDCGVGCVFATEPSVVGRLGTGASSTSNHGDEVFGWKLRLRCLVGTGGG